MWRVGQVFPGPAGLPNSTLSFSDQGRPRASRSMSRHSWKVRVRGNVGAAEGAAVLSGCSAAVGAADGVTVGAACTGTLGNSRQRNGTAVLNAVSRAAQSSVRFKTADPSIPAGAAHGKTLHFAAENRIINSTGGACLAS